MKLKPSSIIIAVALLLFLLLAGRFGFTVVTIEEAENTVQSEAFDPVAYVDGIWESDCSVGSWLHFREDLGKFHSLLIE